MGPYLESMKNLRSAALLRPVVCSANRPSLSLLADDQPSADGPGAVTARSLGRRLRLALHDLGLLDTVPAGWVSTAGATVRFGDLDVATADHLVRHLEDLAAAVGAPAAPVAGAGQSSLFETGAEG